MHRDTQNTHRHTPARPLLRGGPSMCSGTSRGGNRDASLCSPVLHDVLRTRLCPGASGALTPPGSLLPARHHTANDTDPPRTLGTPDQGD